MFGKYDAGLYKICESTLKQVTKKEHFLQHIKNLGVDNDNKVIMIIETH